MRAAFLNGNACSHRAGRTFQSGNDASHRVMPTFRNGNACSHRGERTFQSGNDVSHRVMPTSRNGNACSHRGEQTFQSGKHVSPRVMLSFQSGNDASHACEAYFPEWNCLFSPREGTFPIWRVLPLSSLERGPQNPVTPAPGIGTTDPPGRRKFGLPNTWPALWQNSGYGPFCDLPSSIRLFVFNCRTLATKT